MAYDEALAARVRDVLRGRRDLAEMKMFGGLAFMVRGHMCCGISGRDLMVRVGPDGYAKALTRPHARPMDFTGRPLKGMIYVDPAGYKSRQALKRWIAHGVAFVLTLPRK